MKYLAKHQRSEHVVDGVFRKMTSATDQCECNAKLNGGDVP